MTFLAYLGTWPSANKHDGIFIGSANTVVHRIYNAIGGDKVGRGKRLLWRTTIYNVTVPLFVVEVNSASERILSFLEFLPFRSTEMGWVIDISSWKISFGSSSKENISLVQSFINWLHHFVIIDKLASNNKMYSEAPFWKKKVGFHVLVHEKVNILPYFRWDIMRPQLKILKMEYIYSSICK